MLYVDSSLILARYLEEARRKEAEAIWRSDEDLVSSALTVAETMVSLRRAAASRPGPETTRWLKSALPKLESDLLLVSLAYDLREPIDWIRKDRKLSSCRASDALHVATALWLRDEAGGAVHFASFDERQRKVASLCGLPLLPA